MKSKRAKVLRGIVIGIELLVLAVILWGAWLFLHLIGVWE